MAKTKRDKDRARRARAREVAETRKRKKRVRIISATLVIALVFGLIASALAIAFTSDSVEDATTTTTTLALSACPEAELPAVREITLDPPSFEANPQIDPAKTYTAVMQTSCGDMTFELFAADASVDVNNFVYLARQGFYDDVLFHRIINGFVVQGGDPTAADPARAGTGGPGYEYTGNTPTPAQDGSNTYAVGSLAMANSAGPSTNGSQFFIVSGPDGERLPPNFSLFGQLTEGFDVLDDIQTAPTVDAGGYPEVPVVIRTITITES